MYGDDPSIFPSKSKFAAAVFRVRHTWEDTLDELWKFVRECFPQSYGRNVAAFDLAVEKGKARWLVLVSNQKATAEPYTVFRVIETHLPRRLGRSVSLSDYWVEVVSGVPAHGQDKKSRSQNRLNRQ
jgi:hypothetical protein